MPTTDPPRVLIAKVQHANDMLAHQRELVAIAAYDALLGGCTGQRVADALGVSRSSLYRLLRSERLL